MPSALAPIASPEQLRLFADIDAAVPKDSDTSGTFADNLSLPIHRWFRYSAGFSSEWAHELIARERSQGRRRVLDPFAGSGTVPLAGEQAGVEAIGLEAHPFVCRIARAKLAWRSSAEVFLKLGRGILERAEAIDAEIKEFPDLIQRCYSQESLRDLAALRSAWAERADGTPASELAWLALTACLRECSPVGTAQWQYVLPKKSKARTASPLTAFARRIGMMAADMRTRDGLRNHPAARVEPDDARVGKAIADGWADLVVTSPPYANNYDYADATRLEMCFWGDVASWADLQRTVRNQLVVSCTQHVAATRECLEDILAHPVLTPILGELREVCARLSVEREQHGGKKPYDRMIAAYFRDQGLVWQSLRRGCAEGARVCFVVGDSAPYGVHAPVERWLGELALSSRFASWRFEKLRDRNMKWKNRKHRVPLHEGRLWVEG